MNENLHVSIALKELLPLSVVNETACFVFYDDHPRDHFTLDIIICSHRGLVQEYFQKELINSILLENATKVSEIRILRNSKCELFYLVSAENELIILSRKKNPKIHQRITNVDTYEIGDTDCRGYASLKITLKDDAVPLVFDDNFDKLAVRTINMESVTSEESLPIINQLMRKLNEAKYTTKCNENTLNEYLNLRQTAAFSVFQKTQPNSDNAIIKLNYSEISNALQVKTQAPIVKCCNKKIVIIFSLLNKNTVPITNVTVLLHGTMKQTITYTTKLFKQTPRPPHWKEKKLQIDSNSESTVVAVVDMKEIKDNVLSRIDFDIVVSYSKEENTFLLPLESVNISALDTMAENFDILCDKNTDNNILMLAILATSVQINLYLRHIKNPEDNVATPLDIFCNHLKMETLGMDNIAIHKVWPHHILFGVLVVFQDNVGENDHVMNIQVYSRSHSQVLALIHYIYDAVPYRIIATTQDCKISAIVKDLSMYNENQHTTNYHLNYQDYALSFSKQATAIKEYFDNCMIAMSENKNIEIKNKIGFEVDLLAQGLPKYLEFRNRLLEESLNSIRNLTLEENTVSDNSDITIIDD